MDRAITSASSARASRNSSRNARFSRRSSRFRAEARATRRSNLAALPRRFSPAWGGWSCMESVRLQSGFRAKELTHRAPGGPPPIRPPQSPHDASPAPAPHPSTPGPIATPRAARRCNRPGCDAGTAADRTRFAHRRVRSARPGSAHRRAGLVDVRICVSMSCRACADAETERAWPTLAT